MLYHDKPARASAPQAGSSCCGPNPPTAPRQLDFPYYELDNGYSSTLNLVSDSPQPIDFIIVLHDLAGDPLISNSTTIQPDSKMAIDLGSLIKSLGRDPTGSFAEGSIQIYFTGTIMPLVGQVTMTNPALHLSQEAEMVENDLGRTDIPAVLSGMWWGLGGGADAYVTVANMSANTVTADVYLDFNGSRHTSSPLVFNPNQTRVISVAQLLGDLNSSPSQAAEGGITIIQRGPNPSLIAQGRVVDSATGFSSTLEFPDPARQPASAVDAVGLPIGTPAKDSPYAGAGSFTPHVIARNLTGQPQTMTVTVEYPKSAAWNSANGPGGPANPQVRYVGPLKKGQPNPNEALNHPPHPDRSTLTGQLALPPLPVAAYSTVDYSLGPFVSALPAPIEFCTIRIQYSGAPGSMIAQVSSVDARQDLVVDAKTMNEGDGWAGSGANPWHLDKKTESILFLTDEGTAPARIGLKVTADGVHYFLAELSLAPGETRAIDIRHLRNAAVADLKGNRIPADAADGSVDWIRLDNVAVSGRVLVISRGRGIASSFDCCTCPCPSLYSLNTLQVSLLSFGLAAGGTSSESASGGYMNCNGDGYISDLTSQSTWSSGNTSVATVDQYGDVTGVAGGTAGITASFTGTVYTPVGYHCNSSSANDQCSATANVPKLSCTSVTRGQTTTCSISNYASGTTFSSWKFTDGTNTVNGSGTSASWSGMAVQSGTVSVTATYNSVNDPLSASLTVNARTGWAFIAVSPVKESNGGGTGACAGGLAVLGSPPTATSGDMGKSCFAPEEGWGVAQVTDAGPNSGYWYTTSASSSNNGVATAYQWERVPDLDNTSSTFYQKQTGTYNSSSDPSGCISGSNLATQTQRHEIGLASSNYIESHWGEYQAALSNSSNNPGVVIEKTTGAPSDSTQDFNNSVTSAVTNANSGVVSAYQAEPYGVDHTEYGVFLGYVNYAPNYNNCQ